MLAVALISGFTEDEGDMTGTYALEQRLYHLYGADLIVYNVREWKEDMKDFAKRIKRDGVENCAIVGYSWGGGYGAQKLANQLIKRDIGVPVMLLCDPVYRPLWLPTWGIANLLGFRALVRDSALIKVNDRVGAVEGIRQVHNRPMGHDLWYRGRKKELHLVVGYEHSEIDNSRVWHDLVVSEISKMITLGGAHNDWN